MQYLQNLLHPPVNPTHEVVAIIDLGTNTFHLLIVEISDRENFTIRDKAKEVVKLGEGGINEGFITLQAFERGIAALVRFRKIMDSRGAQKVLACGTSALRGAQNAQEFLAAAREEASIDIRIINGNEEAVLIYKGVRGGVQFPYDEDVLLVDIGGGSVEFIVGNHLQPKLLRSLRLGAARLLETVQPSDPITPKEIAEARRLIEEQASSLLQEIREFGPRRLVGSSGSFETLAAMVAFESADLLSMENPNGYRFDRKRFKKLLRRLLSSTRLERLAIPGMEPARVDMILMAGILIDYLLDELQIDPITVSTYALKEGILFDYLEGGRERRHDEHERNLREKAVLALGKRFQFEGEHAAQVSRLALQFFDQLQQLHNYGQEERELLSYAALLHDTGKFINHSGHHKHSQYIVMNSGLAGFSTDELLLMGNIVRYHRKSTPSREHFHFNVLYKEHKDIVRKLAGILRLADALDRGHRGFVQQLNIVAEGAGRLRCQVKASTTVDIELETARMATALFQEAFLLTIDFQQLA